MGTSPRTRLLARNNFQLARHTYLDESDAPLVVRNRQRKHTVDELLNLQIAVRNPIQS
jgi:hypothetical protein